VVLEQLDQLEVDQYLELEVEEVALALVVLVVLLVQIVVLVAVDHLKQMLVETAALVSVESLHTSKDKDMRFALISDGVVVNVIELDGGTVWTPPVGQIAVQSDTAQLNDRYEDDEFVTPTVIVDPESVTSERNRRINDGILFNGVRYQTRQEDRENILGAFSLAFAAMIQGKQPGDYRWHGGSSDFTWIAEDNTTHVMDAQTVVAFGQAVAAQKSKYIFISRAIKDMSPIPLNYDNDAYWNI
jgi:hypothetical protein